MIPENLLLMLPILVPFVTGMLDLLGHYRHRWQQIISVGGALAQVLVSGLLLLTVSQSGVLAIQIGGWEAPFGISIVADLFSAIMVLVTAVVYLAVTVFSLARIDKQSQHLGYFALISFLVMGVTGALMTGDAFNLYVWFEILLIASFVLTTLGNEKRQLEGAVKYLTLNILSSTMFLVGLGLLYRLAGTMNFADLALTLRDTADPGLTLTVAMMFLVAFAIKAGAFPVYFWLPAAYPTPPVVVTALFSGLLTKVGVYALIRFFTLIFVQDITYTHTIIVVVAGLTMVFGVLGAVAQYDVRRLLSFHIISQIGYLLMGLGIFTVTSLTGTIFFLVHVIIAKAALFLVAGIAQAIRGSYHLKKMGGLYADFPWLSVLFLFPALSLGGIPPFSGFWAKFTLVKAGLEAQWYGLVLVALIVSVLTLFSMTKIFAYAYWSPDPRGEDAPDNLPSNLWQMVVPVAGLAALTILLGVLAEPLLALSAQAAQQLIDPQAYINAVGVAYP